MNALLQIVDAAATPLLAIIALIVWKIKTNDLPHILDRLGHIEGKLNSHDELERSGRKRRR